MNDTMYGEIEDNFHDCEDSSNKKDAAIDELGTLKDEDDVNDEAYCKPASNKGTTTACRYGNGNHHNEQTTDPSSSSRHLMKRMSQRIRNEVIRRQSSLVEAMPETPAGWAILLSALSSLCVGYELKLQKSLTVPPTVYSQLADDYMRDIYQRLTASPASILRRTIQPSLFVGTRGVVASTAAYLGAGPSKAGGYLDFREIVTMSQDGAEIALDWELPPSTTPDADREAALKGPLKKHVVLILHGINNDASFGYMRALMRACTNRGWAAVGENFRGCGGARLTTPRGYNGSYTGDIRGVVRILEGRMADGMSMFIVGNSLGANLITKYLGEEGRSGTLPKCIAGAVSLGNPLLIHGRHIMFPWGHLLSLGARKTLLEHIGTMSKFKSPHYQRCIRKALMASTLGKFDEALAPVFIRNNSFSPYEIQYGYENAEEYWHDASSSNYVRFVSVPLLQLTSEDDFLVSTSSAKKLHFSISNPNIIVVNTRCGGHLGWQECPPDTLSPFGFGTSWADTATADFIDAVLKTKGASVATTLVPQESVIRARNAARLTAEFHADGIQSRL